MAIQTAHTEPTIVHARYAAEALLLRRPSHDQEKLTASLTSATIDLNPHQIEAALFAFRSPLSRGALLADEVGLGKTIEAGLIVSQLWAEKRRRILVIAPTSLRKQWAEELREKFFLPTVVLDGATYNAELEAGISRPFEDTPRIIICSYHFAWAKEAELRDVPWDLVVIDEAHRLRNVFKTGNKIASSIQRAIGSSPKILLTATPLQNNLLELYGLVSFIDEHVFGNLPAFRAQFGRVQLDSGQFLDLKHRIRPICHRTLRSQVTEFIRFTRRVPLTQEFVPSEKEQLLYDEVSAYLQREDAIALPASQRQLITLVLRKLLASSTFAVAGTLQKMVQRLEAARAGGRTAPLDSLHDYEGLDALSEQWEPPAQNDVVVGDAGRLSDEIAELRGYLNLATSIQHNAKADALLKALDTGFEKMAQLGAARKAVVFTESMRTQAYLLDFLERNGYAGKVVTFNGTNNDPRAQEAYQAWLARHADDDTVAGSKEIDIRAALVDHFRDHGEVLVATEAAAEGVNLQFASLVVNYDLPWNPQRIEQRIGRCHRYGQKHDVVVINFINKANAADVRVFELLSEKFRLFDGVFGSSDEILGSLESGVDFERRIAEIYNTCRTTEAIDAAFDALQRELDDLIKTRMGETRQALLEHFDEEVHARFKSHADETGASVDRFQRWLWTATRFALGDAAEFDEATRSFVLRRLPKWSPAVPHGRYAMIRHGDAEHFGHVYRYAHPLAEAALERVRALDVEPCEMEFRYTDSPAKVSAVEALVGKRGWLQLHRVTVESLEREQHFLWVGETDDGRHLDAEDCAKLLEIPGSIVRPADIDPAVEKRLRTQHEEARTALLRGIEERNTRFFEAEMDKLDRWAQDLKLGLEQELRDLDVEIAQAKKDARAVHALQEKLEGQRRVKELEARRMRKRREFFETQDHIDGRKDSIIDEIAKKMGQTATEESILSMRWSVV